jgi:AcrR family transcriptional regulator
MQQRSEETRAHILQAAMTLFSKNGYDASSVAEICQAAGVSKGAFYHHFASKQAVFQSLLEGWLAGLNQQMDALLNNAPDVPAGFLQLVRLASPIFHDARGQFPMFLEFWTQSSRDPALWATAIAPYRHFLELFSNTLAKGIQQGSIRPVDPKLAAQALLALAMGIVLQEVMDPQETAGDGVAELGMRLLFEGLQPSQEKNI